MVWILGEERRDSICEWRFGGKGSERSCARALGVVRRADMKLGSRISGFGCRVRAE